jgi:hypothetical protein
LTTALANISGVSSGISDKSISSFFIVSRRSQSVCDFLEIVDLFIFCRFSSRYDTDIFTTFCERYYDHQTSQDAKSDKSWFTIIETLIRDDDNIAIENLWDIDEINAKFFDIGGRFRSSHS